MEAMVAVARVEDADGAFKELEAREFPEETRKGPEEKLEAPAPPFEPVIIAVAL